MNTYHWEEFTYIRPEERDLYLSLGFAFQGDFIRNNIVAPVSFSATIAELYKQIGASENGQIVGRVAVFSSTAAGMAAQQQTTNRVARELLKNYRYPDPTELINELLLKKEKP